MKHAAPPARLHANTSQAAFDAYSHYKPLQKTRYTVTAPPGLRPAPWIVDHVVEVTDTGCGLSADELGKLFQPFEQIAAGAKQKGGGTGA